MIKSGLSIHCHHNILVEYCYDYDKRVEVIKRDKPENEQEIRLGLFKLLPEEAINELPKELITAYAEYRKADAEWQKADAEYQKAYAEWQKADREIWHKKWCGCKEWENGTIRFIEQNYLVNEPHTN